MEKKISNITFKEFNPNKFSVVDESMPNKIPEQTLTELTKVPSKDDDNLFRKNSHKFMEMIKRVESKDEINS